MTANRRLLFVPLIALLAIIVAIGCDGWDGEATQKHASKTPRSPKAAATPDTAASTLLVDDPVLEKALQVEADLTRVTSASEALEKLSKELAEDASLAPELTPNLIAYARLADKVDVALEKAKPFAEENANHYERLLRLTQAIVEPAAFLGLEKPSEAIARRKDNSDVAWAKTESGKKLAKIAVQAGEQGQKQMLEEGDPALFEHLFDQLHVGLLVAEAHRAAGHRHKAIKAVEEALSATRRQREEIRSTVEELRGFKRQLSKDNSAVGEDSTDEDSEDEHSADRDDE